MKERQVRVVRPGEMLAMPRESMHQGPQGFFWFMGGGLVPNDRRGSVAIVHVRGELEHHADSWGFCESYEGIKKKVRAAVEGEEDVDQDDDDHWSKPSALVLCIDSPGGVVAGLNETVKALRKMRAEYGIPFIAYVNEMAASAAYALACSCDKIYCPPSAILGSIGVISTMVSQARRNKREGFDVVLITSGDRKADGHLYAPIMPEAVEAERARVNKLASAFFKLASRARGLSPAKLEALEAGIFLGKDAASRGLADGVMSLDELVGTLESEAVQAPEAGGNETDRRVGLDKSKDSRKTLSALSGESSMYELKALIQKKKAAIAKAKDEKARKGLQEDLTKLEAALAVAAPSAGYKKTKHVKHTEEQDDGGDDEDDEDGDDEEDEGEDEEESAEMDDDEKSKASSEDEGEDEEEDEEDEEESEEEEAKATLAMVHQITGMKGAAARGALKAMSSTVASMQRDVEAMKVRHRADRKESIIRAHERKYLTKADAAWLRTQSLKTVAGFCKARKAAGTIVHTEDGELLQPRRTREQAGTGPALSKDARDGIDEAMRHLPPGIDQKAMREAMEKAQLEAQSGGTARNGEIRLEGGRY